MATCRGCKEKIDWVKLTSGANHPVEGEYLMHDQCKPGETLVTDGGNVIVVGEVRKPSIKGRISHFAVCPMADKFRKKIK